LRKYFIGGDAMEVKRDQYLNKLIRRKHNGMIKVVTGLRRCGKSYLLFELFYRSLRESGVPDDHIIKIALDDRANIKYRNPDALYEHLRETIHDTDMYYILLDEVQLVNEFEDVLNSMLHIKNADTFVTGSNAKFLSKDIITEFRGRGDQVHMYPLSFSEFMSAFEGSEEEGWQHYMTYGGMPYIIQCVHHEQKVSYLTDLFSETYIKDVVSRNHIKNPDCLNDLLNIIASSIGSLTNPTKLANTFKTVKHVGIASNTIKEYLDFLSDSFIIEKADRYDVKGKRYIETPAKYYFTDIGLRNARLGFRQNEETHIMENIIYNELRIRDYSVDVGVVNISEPNEKGNYVRKQTEVDFVCNFASSRYYIQSALNVSSAEKMEQEARSLRKIDDSFKKIIVVKDPIIPWRTEDGILIVGIRQFLMNPRGLEEL